MHTAHIMGQRPPGQRGPGQRPLMNTIAERCKNITLLQLHAGFKNCIYFNGMLHLIFICGRPAVASSNIKDNSLW